MDPRLARVPSRALTLPQFPETVPRSERALHAALAAISAGAAASAQQFGEDTAEDAVVFCGINAHDMENAARVGAAAASQLGVVNPLAGLSPEAVTALAQVCIHCATLLTGRPAGLLMCFHSVQASSVFCFGSMPKAWSWVLGVALTVEAFANAGFGAARLGPRRGIIFQAALAYGSSPHPKVGSAGQVPIKRAPHVGPGLKF